ncbi:universal stress protein [Aurantiacibacter hainanensis]|uniref:universal stress protein n=1 Tax=Aurantiacibacter hainanensis TaxID=3076114 RepID=UPI0030C72E6C
MDGPIVAATDFSARADRAVDRAIMLAEELGNPVELIHAVEYAPGSTVDRPALDRAMRAVVPETGVEVSFAYPEGSVPAAIARHAEEHDVAMIVLGVARYNSVGDYFLGTAVDRVIRGTSKPVIVVKARPRESYGKILVATDFSDPSREALDWVAAKFPRARISLLHAYSVPFEAWNKASYVAEEIEKEAKARLEAVLDDLPDAVTSRTIAHVIKGSLCQAVNQLVESEGIDLVAVGSQGETGFRHATIGSQAMSVLENAKVDTVVIGPRVA